MADTNISGREPRLSKKHKQRGDRRVPLRRLGGLLEGLAPEAISPQAAGEMLRSDDFYVRYSAARLLGQRGDRASRLVLEEALESGNAPTRASAARHLYGLSWFSAEPLIRQALGDGDERVRESAVYTLCDAREKPAFALLTEVLSGAGDALLETAAWGLQNCRDPAAVPALAQVLKASDPTVRSKALETLGLNDSPEAVPVVRDAIGDVDPEVTYSAVLSIMELLGEDGLVEVASFIRQTEGEMRQFVLKGFFHASNYMVLDVAGNTAADAILDALEIAMRDSLPAMRREAAYPLAWIRHQRAGQIFRDAFAIEVEAGVQVHMLEVAASLMSESLDDLLQTALESGETVVVEVAKRIAAQLAEGQMLAYDPDAAAGEGFQKPLAGR